ncbi:MAG: hypothetical protein JXN64_05540 [Spirochaetes bacterium]|nr:hypothetical protein [Spirochaetota bacterium]
MKNLLIIGGSLFLFLLGLFAFQVRAYPEEYEGTALHENADENISTRYNLGGYIKSGIFSWDDEFREIFAEGSLKLESAAGTFGNAFAELRYRASSSDSEDKSDFNFREAYAEIYAGKLDIRSGKQVIVWGRADGFNPTNNITPSDYTVFSSEEDDRRMSNFVVKGVFNADPFKLEADWVPVYLSSELPFGNASMPAGIEWANMDAPKKKPENSTFAVKVEIESASFDGSLSYYNGYYKTPGLDYYISQSVVYVQTKPFRTQVAGVDFSTTVGKYGLRGEFALSIPEDTKEDLAFPGRQAEYTIGIDREWRSFSCILQYIGKYVIDYDRGADAPNTLEKELIAWNRMIFSQQEEWNHSASLRLSLSLMHETLALEVLGLANFSTEEVYFQPKASYTISDAFVLCAGAQLYYGPDDTLFGFMEKNKNALFMEIKKSF